MGTEADYLIDQHWDRKHGEYGVDAPSSCTCPSRCSVLPNTWHKKNAFVCSACRYMHVETYDDPCRFCNRYQTTGSIDCLTAKPNVRLTRTEGQDG